MARPGITYHDVAKAALELTGQGKFPTIEGIRQFLGSGSSSTIAPHLRAWKAKQGETQLIASQEKLPEDLVALMKGLWGRVLQEAEAQVSVIKQDADKTLGEHKQQIETLAQENRRLQQNCNQLLQKEQHLANDKLALEQAIIQLQNEKTALEAESKTFHQRGIDKQAQVDELQRLNRQVQNNLDHYREASREQRLKEQQQYENQIKYLEQSVQQYLQENSHLKKQWQLSYEKLDQLQNDNHLLKAECQNSNVQLNDTASQLALAKANLATALKNETHWQAHYQDVSSKLNDREKLVSELQKQMALLSQKLSTTENQLDKISHQNKLLAHEKWQLGQEAAQLMGQLKRIKAIN